VFEFYFFVLELIVEGWCDALRVVYLSGPLVYIFDIADPKCDFADV
jgi:hypothetical protein